VFGILPGMENESLISVVTLARRLALPPNWLRCEAKAGRIPALRVGRKLRFDFLSVRNALAKRASEEGVNHAL